MGILLYAHALPALGAFAQKCARTMLRAGRSDGKKIMRQSETEAHEAVNGEILLPSQHFSLRSCRRLQKNELIANLRT